MGILKQYQRVVTPRVDHKPDAGNATRIRGFVPVSASQGWLKQTTSEKTITISLSSVIATNAVAVLIVQRLQDDAMHSYIEARAKTSVSTNPAAKHRLSNRDTTSVMQYSQGIIPVNTDREIMWQINDGKSTSVQTASLGILGYYY